MRKEREYEVYKVRVHIRGSGTGHPLNSEKCLVLAALVFEVSPRLSVSK